MLKTTVFLGGTCASSTWRDELQLLLNDTVDAFNPVVADWNAEAQANEKAHRASDHFCLYTITPKLEGFFSIAEVTDDSNKRPAATLLLVLAKDGEASFNAKQLKSLRAIADLVHDNGGREFTSLEEVAEFLNVQARRY